MNTQNIFSIIFLVVNKKTIKSMDLKLMFMTIIYKNK